MVQALLADHVAHADEVAVLGGDLDGQVTLGHLQLQVDLVDTLDGPGVDLLDERRPVMRVDDRFSDLERHVVKPLSRPPSYHANQPG